MADTILASSDLFLNTMHTGVIHNCVCVKTFKRSPCAIFAKLLTFTHVATPILSPMKRSVARGPIANLAQPIPRRVRTAGKPVFSSEHSRNITTFITKRPAVVAVNQYNFNNVLLYESLNKLTWMGRSLSTHNI